MCLNIYTPGLQQMFVCLFFIKEIRFQIFFCMFPLCRPSSVASQDATRIQSMKTISRFFNGFSDMSHMLSSPTEYLASLVGSTWMFTGQWGIVIHKENLQYLFGSLSTRWTGSAHDIYLEICCHGHIIMTQLWWLKIPLSLHLLCRSPFI